MKISHSAENPAPLPVLNSAAAAAASEGLKTTAAVPTTASSSSADASAKIQISNTAASLLSNSDSAYFDADKVARISLAIETGNFKINPEAIADKLISNAREVLTRIPD